MAVAIEIVSRRGFPSVKMGLSQAGRFTFHCVIDKVSLQQEKPESCLSEASLCFVPNRENTS